MTRAAQRKKGARTKAETGANGDTAAVLADLALTGPAPYLIRRLQQMVTAIYAEEMATFGVTAPQYAALLVVVDTPMLDQNTTAYLAGIDRTTIVGVINRLVNKGLLRRTVSKVDRRARLLKPTPAGKRFVRKVSVPIGRISSRLLDACPPAERDAFCDILRLLLRGHLYAEAQQLSVDLARSPIKPPRRRRKSRSSPENSL